MPTLVGSSPGAGTRTTMTDSGSISRRLVNVYSRERLEDAVRAIAEDALSPSRSDFLPWHAEDDFDDQLGIAVREIAASANVLLAERLADLLESAPPSVRGRMVSVPRWSEQP